MSNEPPFPERPPTLADLGRILGLSKRAVSQALNEREGTVKVSAATRERVQALAKKMGYRQNTAAAALSTGRTGQFGILAPVGRMHVNATHLASAVDAFGEFGISPIVVYSSAKSSQGQESNLSTLIGARLDGLVLLNRQSHFTDEHVDELRRFGISVVQVGSTVPAPSMCHYLTDRKQAFQLIFDHLVEQGYRRIGAIVGGEIGAPGTGLPSVAGTQTRMAILESANIVRNRGIDLRLQIHDVPIDSTASDEVHRLYEPGYRCMLDIIRNQEVPEALICQVDGWAWGAMRACAEAGIRVPDDLAITGYSNEPACSATYVPLTSVDEPFEAMCRAAVQELVQSVRENRRPVERAVVMDCRLSVRQSSLRPRASGVIKSGKEKETTADTDQTKSGSLSV